jgi:hypothetical protein
MFEKTEPIIKVTTEDIRGYSNCKCCGEPGILGLSLGSKEGKVESTQTSRLCKNCATQVAEVLYEHLELKRQDESLMEAIKNINLEEETRG